MENVENTDLLLQVRSAHRLLAAYYQRIFQLLTDVTGDERLGLNYYLWRPSNFNRPCQQTTNVFSRSAWDLVPGMNTNYLFHTAKDNNKQSPGEWMIDMCVISDSGTFENDELDSFEDALALNIKPKNASSVLRGNLFTVGKESSFNWYEGIWRAYEYEICTDAPAPRCVNAEFEIYACSFEIPLGELTGENAKEKLIEKIIQFKTVLLKSAE